MDLYESKLKQLKIRAKRGTGHRIPIIDSYKSDQEATSESRSCTDRFAPCSGLGVLKRNRR
jgi:16S rRNA (cytosine967-C5)-methyltransferase